MSDKAETNETLDTKPRTGRRNVFTPALLDKLLSYIADGLNFKQACAACLVSESTFRKWRTRPGVAERVESAREVMRASILAKIKEAGAKDWRAHAEFLRLTFAEYRFANGPSVNIAVQQTMELRDPERASLIERRERALATSAASDPPQLADSDARTTAEAAESQLARGVIEVAVEPEHLREKPPTTVVQRDDLIEERREWREAAQRDPVEEILDF